MVETVEFLDGLFLFLENIRRESVWQGIVDDVRTSIKTLTQPIPVPTFILDNPIVME